MLWKGRRQSENVEDRRGITGRGVALGGGLGALALTIIVLLLGGNPQEVMQSLQTSQPANQEQAQPLTQEEKDLGEFVGVILADTEDVWNQVFQQAGEQYRDPKLVLFTNATESACGNAQAAVGPFYCSADEKVYIDLGFFQEMQQRLGARGDFAWAYVIAHEVGHHVQNLLGVMQPGAGKDAGPGSGGGQSHVGAPGAPCRLPRRDLGQPRPAHEGADGGRRHRGRA